MGLLMLALIVVAIMLAVLYVVYVIILAKLKPSLAPPLSEEERRVSLLGGQEIINAWVLSMDLTPVEFMIMAQIVIFLLGWPLEWTEIIVIFMPIFLPLLAHYNIDPLFFGILVALNLQTAFLSPPPLPCPPFILKEWHHHTLP